MTPNEHNSRLAVRFTFIGVFVVLVGVFVAIYNREMREQRGFRRESPTSSESPVVEPILLVSTSSVEILNPADNVGGLEAPPPYEPFAPEFDLTKGRDDVCPVHKVKMPAKVAPIHFRFDTRWVSEFETRKEAEFPFAYGFIHDTYVGLINPPNSGLMFCGTGLPDPTSAKMFVCPQCLAAYETAIRAFNAKLVEARRAEATRRVAPKQQ